MTLLRSKTSRFRMLALLMLAGATLSACTPAPEPTPTPTAAFASEEEAFAAAEEVYREFTDRLNEVDISDPATFEPLYELSSGSFETADRESYSKMHAEGYSVTGETRVVQFEGVSASPPFDTIVANACVDVSDVKIVDASGASAVSPDRQDRNGIEITFVRDSSSLFIDSAKRIDDAICANS